MAGPDLSVVCRNCGSEVSPYVTECPYCGTRLRKRAPRIEREGDEMKVREGRRERRLRRSAERRQRTEERRAGFERFSARREELATRPVATVLLIAIPAILYIVLRASGSVRGAVPVETTQVFLDIFDATFGDDPWRYLIAPFFFVNAGYLFICGLAIAIFGPPLERRMGTLAVLVLGVACGALGVLGSDGIRSALGDGAHVAAGANGIALGLFAAWLAMKEPERRADPDEAYDPIAVGIVGAVLLVLPVFFAFADFWAGLVGGLVGGACGLVATLVRREER